MAESESYVDKIARLKTLGAQVPRHEQDAVNLYFDLCEAMHPDDAITHELISNAYNAFSSITQAYIKLYREVASAS